MKKLLAIIVTTIATSPITHASTDQQTEIFMMGGQNACIQAINSVYEKKRYQASTPSFVGNGGVSGSSYVYKFRANYSYWRGNTNVIDWAPVDCLINPQTRSVSIRENKK